MQHRRTNGFLTFFPHTVRCSNLFEIANGAITYTPPFDVSSDVLPPGERFVGTIATYSCSPGYQLVGGSSLRACSPSETWNGTEPSCGEQIYVYVYTILFNMPGNTCI